MIKNILSLILIITVIISGFIISKLTSFQGNKKIIIKKPYNKLIIVAHPDDETLWGYNQLNKKNGWKILCITNANNNIRVKELTHIANYFNAALEIWNYTDNPVKYNMHPQLYIDIKKEIDKPNVKMVLTHNPLGEYGHIQHKKVSQVVLTVSKKPTYVFSYGEKIKEGGICSLSSLYKSQEKIFLEHCNKIPNNKIYKVR
jgi:hypothetical protein